MSTSPAGAGGAEGHSSERPHGDNGCPGVAGATGAGPVTPRRVPAALVLAASFAAGSVPWSNLASRALRGVDLRAEGTGTVSATGLYRVAGFGPLALVGCLDMATGALGPALAGKRRPRLGALAASTCLAGHNWSPLLSGAGGRGIAPGLGAMLILAPEGSAVLAAGLAAGRLARQTGLGCSVALAALVPALRSTRGHDGAFTAAAVALPIALKRLLGDRRPDAGWTMGTLTARLMLDADTAG